VFGKAKGLVGSRIPKEVFLFETEPEVIVVVFDSSPTVGRVGGTIRTQNFAHYEERILAGRILEDGDRLKKTV
jgi:hypothetical protein